ncbi:MAG: winged helix-turn-helix transcriptional regulator [Streptosporangiaceae bacterium]
MLGNSYEGQVCSAARSLEVVGERWSLLIVRDALFGGVTRFNDFARRLGLARNILAARLEGFVEAGVMERFSSEGSAHQEYRLTDKGRDLAPVIIALTGWGDRWAAPNGRPIIYRHADCGGEVEQQLVCSECRMVLDHDQVGVELGPGITGAA